MGYTIGNIPTHGTPTGAHKIETENPTGPASEWATLLEVFDALDSDIKYTFDTTVSAGNATNPGSGKYIFNNATPSSATRINISKTDAHGNALSGILASLYLSSHSTRSIVMLRTATGTQHAFAITGSGSVQTNHISIPITPITMDSISNGATTRLQFGIAGDDGAAGTSPRTTLLANATYYVRNDGSDSNDGSTNTSGSAFLTVQHAVNVVANTIDLGGFTVTIQCATGTYTENIIIPPWTGAGTVLLLGDTTTPSNCLLTSSSGNTLVLADTTSGVRSVGSRLTMGGFKIASSASNGIVINTFSQLEISGKMEYGACGGTQIICRGFLVVTADYTISATASSHLQVNNGGQASITGRTITLTGSPVFPSGFINAQNHGRAVCNGNAFSGSVGGSSSPRFLLATIGLISTAGAGATYLPGNAAGTNDGTAVYDIASKTVPAVTDTVTLVEQTTGRNVLTTMAQLGAAQGGSVAMHTLLGGL